MSVRIDACWQLESDLWTCTQNQERDEVGESCDKIPCSKFVDFMLYVAKHEEWMGPCVVVAGRVYIF